MVKICFRLFILLFLFFFDSPLSFSVDLNIDFPSKIEEITPTISGTLSIRHQQDENISPTSFKIGQQPLPVEFISQEKYAQGSVISRYIFTIKNPGKGLHTLPSISLQVNERIHKTSPITFEVSSQFLSEPLILEAEVRFDGAIYPGQTGIIQYKIFYKGDVSLTLEELPLLEAEGFTKIGRMEIQDERDGEFNVQTITQKIQTQQAGVFNFGQSILEGLLYLPDGETFTISASTPPISVQVLSFPEERQPGSFNGALGNFSIQAQVPRKENFIVGDAIPLEITISGEGVYSTVNLPDLSCQPGFSGFFQMSDLPPSSIKTENGKIFTTELRPLSSAVNLIPPIIFSYFDPALEEYGQVVSQPINIVVSSLETEIFPEQEASPKKLEEASTSVQVSPTLKMPSEDIQSLLAPSVPLEKVPALTYTTQKLLFLIPVGCFIIFIQWILAHHLFARREKHRSSSKYLFKEALSSQEVPHRCFHLMEKALLKRKEELLNEGKEEKSDTIQAINRLLEKLSAAQYGLKQDLTLEQALTKLREIL
ncbi:MAG: hypothetical protein Tsb0021_09950 [Chlamydiales bacterium]